MTSLVVAAGGAAWEPAALAAVEGAEHLSLARRCVDVAELLAVARTGAASAALVDPGLPGLDLAVVDELERAGVTVATCGDAEAAAALRIVRSCAAERLAEVDWESWSPRPASRPEPAEQGRTLVVWGPAGAPGRSTLAVGFAAAARARGARVALVDADVAGGTLAQQLGVLDDLSGVLAACRAAGLGQDAVDEQLVEVEPGWRLLTGIARPDMWPHLRIASMDAVVERLRADHDLVVLDVGSGLDLDAGRSRHGLTRHLVETADDVMVVGRADPVGLSRLVRGLAEVAELTGGPPSSLVVNQTRPSLGWNEREIADTLRRLSNCAPDAFLPMDTAGLDAAAMLGRSAREAVPTSPFVRRLDVLVASFLAERRVIASPRST
ncbi:MAG: hypothetical protein QM621_06055 [Aeromicrobium sp.]|uniref:AAA family ATPase n=1 Tax=Aeromicrobium sp. TaxID=1871063 RepID=UPI0039E3E423